MRLKKGENILPLLCGSKTKMSEEVAWEGGENGGDV